jgi:hypothetical protein
VFANAYAAFALSNAGCTCGATLFAETNAALACAYAKFAYCPAEPPPNASMFTPSFVNCQALVDSSYNIQTFCSDPRSISIPALKRGTPD